jgi:hypothetical protein
MTAAAIFVTRLRHAWLAAIVLVCVVASLAIAGAETTHSWSVATPHAGAGVRGPPRGASRQIGGSRAMTSMSQRPPRRSGRFGPRPLQPVPRLLLSRKEAAAALGMSVDTFERRVQPLIKLVPCGQLLLVPVKELERWCEERAHYMAGAA